MVPWGQANAKTPMFKHEFTPYTLLIHHPDEIALPVGCSHRDIAGLMQSSWGCFALYDPAADAAQEHGQVLQFGIVTGLPG